MNDIPGWLVALYTIVCMVVGVGVWELCRTLWRHERPFEDPQDELRRFYHDLPRK